MRQPWVFDAEVAAKFQTHAQQHIPDYLSVIDDAVALASGSCAKDAPIAEIGCATGATLARLHAAGFTNVTGTDMSEPMLEQCNPAHARLLLTSEFPTAFGPYQLVLANWTLHFLPPEKRRPFFAEIYAGLLPGGYLMLTEKCVTSPVMAAQYHAWKRSVGVTQAEIDAKAAALKGVMFSMPANWIISELHSLGFRVDVWRAAYGFITFLAEKRDEA